MMELLVPRSKKTVPKFISKKHTKSIKKDQRRIIVTVEQEVHIEIAGHTQSKSFGNNNQQGPCVLQQFRHFEEVPTEGGDH